MVLELQLSDDKIRKMQKSLSREAYTLIVLQNTNNHHHPYMDYSMLALSRSKNSK